MRKKFLISIDTEGDNLWNWHSGDEIRTENARYLKRFQNLCEKYGFIPTYLTNYEMASDPTFVKFAEDALSRNTCEIGMHLHAWNNPPIMKLENGDSKGGQPYLIEYPVEIMEAKISVITSLLRKRFGDVITHRAGRWATNDTYFSILNRYGYIVDCSVTPGLNWNNNKGGTTGSGGSDYTSFPQIPFCIGDTDMIEIPVSIIRTHHFIWPDRATIKSIGKNMYRAIKGQYIWIRPLAGKLREMIQGLREIGRDKDNDYAMFMIHSSELMPGGSNSFKTEQDIDNLYFWIEKLFSEASRSFTGQSIGDYGRSRLSQLRRGTD